MRTPSPSPTWADPVLVERCLDGDERAWEALIEKYKRFIYAITIRYHMPEDDAADIFQAVCVDLYSQLAEIRNVGALRGWLGQVTAHKCLRWKRDRERETSGDLADVDSGEGSSLDRLKEMERDQIVREAITALPARCQQLVKMLFFEDPPRPYDAVARDLGLATGSVGFIRGRCLKKLVAVLEELGFDG